MEVGGHDEPLREHARIRDRTTPLGKSVVLHLLPGALIVLVFLIFAPVAAASGLLPNFALFAAVLLALIPFEA